MDEVEPRDQKTVGLEWKNKFELEIFFLGFELLLNLTLVGNNMQFTENK